MEPKITVVLLGPITRAQIAAWVES